MTPPTFDRASGLLLPVSALCSRYGIGDLGPSAYRFVDLLTDLGQRWWQVLPVGPAGYGYSPYAGTSSFAGSPLLISPEVLVDDRLLTKDMLVALPAGPVDYPHVIAARSSQLRHAFRCFAARERTAAFAAYIDAQAGWLHGYAAFVALRAHYARCWTTWPHPHRCEPEAAIAFARDRLTTEWEAACFRQYVFDQQWQKLRNHCRRRGIRMLGDLPIYVAHDSADVWLTQDQYFLDAAGRPTVVGGVPPDFFSALGQRWGNPLYRWDVMATRGFDWWLARYRRALDLFDLVRLDHFRGFAAYWEIPAAEPTAVHGRWVRGPGPALFGTLESALGPLKVVAEDLGVITDDVRALMLQFSIPGMAVLQFGFDGDDCNPNHPANYRPSTIAYTGTHDNDTITGWLCGLSGAERDRAARYLNLDASDAHWQAIAAVMGSRAGLAITPVQDVLGLDSACRTNTPGTVDGNWTWRMRPEDLDTLSGAAGECLRRMTAQSGRLPDP